LPLPAPIAWRKSGDDEDLPITSAEDAAQVPAVGFLNPYLGAE
jgi:hypothetical protein